MKGVSEALKTFHFSGGWWQIDYHLLSSSNKHSSFFGRLILLRWSLETPENQTLKYEGIFIPSKPLPTALHALPAILRIIKDKLLIYIPGSGSPDLGAPPTNLIHQESNSGTSSFQPTKQNKTWEKQNNHKYYFIYRTFLLSSFGLIDESPTKTQSSVFSLDSALSRTPFFTTFLGSDLIEDIFLSSPRNFWALEFFMESKLRIQEFLFLRFSYEERQKRGIWVLTLNSKQKKQRRTSSTLISAFLTIFLKQELAINIPNKQQEQRDFDHQQHSHERSPSWCEVDRPKSSYSE